MNNPIDKTKAIHGLRIFLILTIIGITLLFYFTGSEKTWETVKKINILYLLGAFLLILVDLFSGAARIYIFLKSRFQSSFWPAFKANLANIFLAAATPFQTGGGVAQLYVLNHYNIPYSAGLSISVLNFVATLSLLLVSASIALGNIPARFVNNPSLSFAFDISRIAFYITIIFFFLILLRPQTLGRFIRWVIRKLGQFMPSKDHFLQQLSGKFLQFIANYQEHLLYYWRREKMTLVWNFVLTIILYFNKCLVAYVILLGLGIDVGLWEVVMLQMLIIFFLYFAPTPGASLVAETGMSAIMSLIVPTYSLSLFTVLWRFITTYFGVFLGSIVLLRILSQGVHIKEHSTT